MARIRTIKPEFWTDSFMVQLPPMGRLIYIALWTAADDQGFIPDEVERLAMEVMPREDPMEFDDWLQFFVSAGRIDMFVSDQGHTCYQVAKWKDHQRVDKPSKSKIFREGSRKLATPTSLRRMIAEKYECVPGEVAEVSCYYCGASGRVHWHKLSNGRPSAWVTFPGLEIEHLEAEASGGESSCENIVLACRHCNRSKGTKHWVDAIFSLNGMEAPKPFAKVREDSTAEQGTGNREQGKEKGASPPVEPEARPGPVDRVFAHWQQVWDHPQARLDEKRRKVVRAALNRYTEDELIACISGYRHSPHHCGDNERRTVYDELALFLRDAAHIDKGISLHRNEPAQVGRYSPVTHRSARNLEEGFINGR